MLRWVLALVCVSLLCLSALRCDEAPEVRSAIRASVQVPRYLPPLKVVVSAHYKGPINMQSMALAHWFSPSLKDREIYINTKRHAELYSPRVLLHEECGAQAGGAELRSARSSTPHASGFKLMHCLRAQAEGQSSVLLGVSSKPIVAGEVFEPEQSRLVQFVVTPHAAKIRLGPLNRGYFFTGPTKALDNAFAVYTLGDARDPAFNSTAPATDSVWPFFEGRVGLGTVGTDTVGRGSSCCATGGAYCDLRRVEVPDPRHTSDQIVDACVFVSGHSYADTKVSGYEQVLYPRAAVLPLPHHMLVGVLKGARFKAVARVDAENLAHELSAAIKVQSLPSFDAHQGAQ